MTSKTIAVVGLGYVGLPLVVEFGKHGPVIGFDIDQDKVDKCSLGSDPSRELPYDKMRAARHASYTSDPNDLGKADMLSWRCQLQSMKRMCRTSGR